jgi:uncharacterized membrane protein
MDYLDELEKAERIKKERFFKFYFFSRISFVLSSIFLFLSFIILLTSFLSFINNKLLIVGWIVRGYTFFNKTRTSIIFVILNFLFAFVFLVIILIMRSKISGNEYYDTIFEGAFDHSEEY